MSLEEALNKNTEALNRLISVLASAPVNIGVAAPAETSSSGVATDAKPDSAPALSYEDDVRKPFLTLLNTKRDKAMVLLADLGVQNLKGFADQPEKFVELSQKIKEAQNG